MAEGFKLGRIFKKENPEEDLTDRAERLLQRLDFQVIQDIFGEEREKSGVKRTISTFTIKYSSRMRSLGQWSAEKRRITLNLKELYGVASKVKEKGSQTEDVSFESWVTSVFTHELTHAYGHNPCKDSSIPGILRSAFQSMFGDIPESTNVGGYVQRIKSEEGSFRNKYTDFNEAVTDTVAEEVLNEYKRRTADELVRGVDYNRGYPSAIKRLAMFITMVCERVETSPENVWRAIKHGYFSGLNLNDTELGSIYGDLSDALLHDPNRITEYRSKTSYKVEELLSRRLESEDFLERICYAVEELTKSVQQDD